MYTNKIIENHWRDTQFGGFETDESFKFWLRVREDVSRYLFDHAGSPLRIIDSFVEQGKSFWPEVGEQREIILEIMRIAIEQAL